MNEHQEPTYKDIFIESDIDKLETIDSEEEKINELITNYESGKKDKKEIIKIFSEKYFNPDFQKDNKIISLYALEELFKLFKHDDRALNAEILEEMVMSGLVINDEEFQDCYLGIMGYYCETDKMLQLQLDTKTSSIKNDTLNDEEKKEELNTILINASEAAKELISNPNTHEDVKQFIRRLFDIDQIGHSDEVDKSKFFGKLYGHDPEYIHAIINEMLDKQNTEHEKSTDISEIIKSPHIRILPEGQIPSQEIIEHADKEPRTMDGNHRQLFSKKEAGEIIPLRAFIIPDIETSQTENLKHKYLVLPKTTSGTLRSELQLVTYHSLKLTKDEKEARRNKILDKYHKKVFDELKQEYKDELGITSPKDFTIQFETLVKM